MRGYRDSSIEFAPKAYNPSVFLPSRLWDLITNTPCITLKGLVLIGWRSRNKKETRPLREVLIDSYSMRLHDILELAQITDKKRTHVKFLGRESRLAARIYAEHLRLSTTISNYLLYLTIQGLYVTIRVVEVYPEFAEMRTRLEECSCYTRDLIRCLVYGRLMRTVNLREFYARILEAIREVSLNLHRKMYAQLAACREVNEAADIITKFLFRIRPRRVLAEFVKTVLSSV